MSIIAFFSTIIIGFLADSILGNLLNWPDCGAIFAIATMGTFILYTMKRNG